MIIIIITVYQLSFGLATGRQIEFPTYYQK